MQCMITNFPKKLTLALLSISLICISTACSSVSNQASNSKLKASATELDASLAVDGDPKLVTSFPVPKHKSKYLLPTPMPTPLEQNELGFAIHELSDGEGAFERMSVGQFVRHPDGCLAWIGSNNENSEDAGIPVVVIDAGQPNSQDAIQKLKSESFITGQSVTVGGWAGLLQSNMNTQNSTKCLVNSSEALFLVSLP